MILFSLQVILTLAEHHSAIVPWQLVAQKTGAILKFVSLNENEAPDIEKLRQMISRKTKIIVVHHVSNMLGMLLCLERLQFGRLCYDDIPHMLMNLCSLYTRWYWCSEKITIFI